MSHAFKRIDRWRTALKLNQKQWAEHIGVSQTLYAMWKKGSRVVRKKHEKQAHHAHTTLADAQRRVQRHRHARSDGARN